MWAKFAKVARMYQSLEAQLTQCRTSERFHFSWQLRQLKKHPNPSKLEQLAKKIAESCQWVERKQKNQPEIEYDLQLPVNQAREDILQAIQNHQVVVIAGETGSGKTTQIPKMCLELGLGSRGLIGHTQPRRIAARSVSARIAEELKQAPGSAVGYKIRFHDKTQAQTYIKVMTDGILLAEAHQDKFLNQYEVLIIDEAHERSLNIDFILGYIKRILPKRPDLKVVITSATIDPERFSKYFENAPILSVSGRTFPVEIRYRPLSNEEDDKNLYQGVIDGIEECFESGPGDVLVFLSGEREIREATEALRKHHWHHVEVLPLYARLSAQEQHRIFESHSGARIILATNVAETSLTVPGIRYVIDGGKARVSRYSYRSQIQRLPIEAISQASAKQRAGRCGRVMSGICIRLYSEEDFSNRAAFTEPEILRTNLAAVILQMLALGLGHIDGFPFIETPDQRFIKDGLQLLMQLGAIDASQQITALGRKVAKFPIDPRLALMLHHAERLGCLQEILIIASFLSVPDPREWPLEQKEQARSMHGRFFDKTSDFLSIVKLWQYLQQQKNKYSKNQFQKQCKKEMLSQTRIRDWLDVYQQLKTLAKEHGLRVGDSEAAPHLVHQALLSGLVMNVGMLTETSDYKGVRAKQFKIFPSSSVKGKPKWLMAFEIFETQQVYARMIASIDVRWVEQAAKHLLGKQYSEPFWDQKTTAVLVHERATLYGLPIYHGRKKQYKHIAPADAREIMIKEALVAGHCDTSFHFLEENRRLVAEVENLESKSRRRDILVDEEVLFAFYDQKIPAEIIDFSSFKKWLKTQSADFLIFKKDSLMRHDAEAITKTDYPEYLEVDNTQLKLSYCFEPTEEEDGITVYIPADVFPKLKPSRFDWLVPGMIEEKIIAQIKALPKQWRTNFVPVPEFAKAALARLTFGKGQLELELSTVLQQITGVSIPQHAWQSDKLPRHLRMNFALIDSQGQTIIQSRVWQSLCSETTTIVNQALTKTQTEDPWHQTGLVTWSFGDLPESITVEREHVHVPVYPRLKADAQSVSLQLYTSLHEAQLMHRRGLGQLILLQESKTVKYLTKNMPQKQSLQLLFSAYGTKNELEDALLLASVYNAFDLDACILKEADFLACLESGRNRWVAIFTTIAETYHQALLVAKSTKQALNISPIPAHLSSCFKDCTAHFERLMNVSQLAEMDMQWCKRLPIYLQGIQLRLEKAKRSPKQDAIHQKLIKPFADKVTQFQAHPAYLCQAEFVHFCWLVEELSLSLFAQKFKTIEKVSVKRLQSAWEKVQSVVNPS